ncbi:hypothetical protein ACLOJK_035126 [Asimina triloba]
MHGKWIDVFLIAFPALPEDLLWKWKRKRNELLPLFLESKKPRRFAVEEEMMKKKVAKKVRKEGAKKGGGGGGGFLHVALPLPPLSLFLDLIVEPNPMWEEMMKTMGKPTVVFNRKLTDSDLRRDLAHCILDRRAMVEVLASALTTEEMKQVYDKEKTIRVVVVHLTLLNGWTEFLHDNHLLKDDLMQHSYSCSTPTSNLDNRRSSSWGFSSTAARPRSRSRKKTKIKRRRSDLN